MHKHHIVPIHAGGLDDPSNIEILSVEDHAEAHRRLFEEHGRWQDRIAWLALSGRIGKEEANIAKAKLGFQDWCNNGGRQQISENTKRQAREGNFHCIGDYQRGRTFDEDHRKKLSEKAMQRTPKTCQHCGKVTSPAMYKRWHGDNCRTKS